MAQRLLSAAGLVGAIVVALALFVGGGSTDRRDGIVATPRSIEPPPAEERAAVDSDELEARFAEALRERLPSDGPSAMGTASAMRPDGGLMSAMTASAMGGDLADPFFYQTPRERERRAEAARNRNWRSLDLVNGLIIGITEGIEKARQEGDDERVESLEASKARLEARRDALQAALGDAPHPEAER